VTRVVTGATSVIRGGSPIGGDAIDVGHPASHSLSDGTTAGGVGMLACRDAMRILHDAIPVRRADFITVPGSTSARCDEMSARTADSGARDE
jgi:hypothetical protein